jgi:hypothetical protein
MKSFNIGIDVGRSAVKVAYSSVVYSFPSVFAYQRNNHSASQLVMKRTDSHEAIIDGQLHLFGQTARFFGDFVFEGSEGEAFREVSCKASLYCVARSLFNSRQFQNRDVQMAINLTYDSFFQKADYQKLLLGKHTVTLVEEKETITFQVSRVFVLYQGYSGLLDHAIHPTSFLVSKDFTDSTGLIVDVGRRTVDISYVEALTVLDGKSYDFGTYKILERVNQILRDKYSVMKEIYEIENFVQTDKKLKTLTGTEVDLKDLMESSATEYSRELLFILQSFFAKKTPDYILLMGGGAGVYEKALKAKYPTIQMLKNPAYSNACGLLKFLDRVSLENG